MEKNRVSVYIALFIVLIIGVIINLFPILSIIPPNSFETHFLDAAQNIKNSNLETVFNCWKSGNIVEEVYIYSTSLIMNISGSPNYFWVRFPSALITAILTLSLFKFDGMQEKLGNSFIASLVFMGCAYIAVLCYRITPIMFPALLTIASFATLYRWLREPSYKKALLISITIGLNMIIIGILSVIVVSIVGIIFLIYTSAGKIKNWFVFIASLFFGIFFSFLCIYIVTGNKEIAELPIVDFSILTPLFTGQNAATIFIMYILFALFPWSVPLIISLPWSIKHHKEIYNKFLGLRLLQRFGIAIFVISLPSFWFYSEFSFVMLVAGVFFNSLLIGEILIHQFNRHPITWKITGFILGIIAGAGTFIFVLLNYGLNIYGLYLIHHSWDWWNTILVITIFISLYSLSRNDRELSKNNRYFFNIIILYLLVQNLVIGYIIPNLSILK